MAVLGLAFACAALLIAGLPPLPGFLAKFSLMASLLAPEPHGTGAWVLFGLVLLPVWRR